MPGSRARARTASRADPCPTCAGTRLQPVPRAVRLFGRALPEVVQQPVVRALEEVRRWSLSGDAARVGGAALGELVRRLEFLERVGLGYLVARPCRGDAQRRRDAAAAALGASSGAGLTGALYVLDEPTIGLHPRDTGRLLENLRALVDTGSTVLVVEHDADTIRAADHLIDLGPGGGRLGGRIVAAGPAAEVLAARGVTDRARAPASGARTPASAAAPTRDWLRLEGARLHNLRGVDLRLPARPDDGGGRSLRVGEEHARAPGAVPGGARGARANHPAPGPVPPPLGDRPAATRPGGGPVAHRPHAAERAGDLPRHLGRAAASVRGHPGGAARRASAPARFSFNSAGGGRCPACAGQGEHQPRDVLPPRRHHALRGVRRGAVRAGDAGGPLARAERRRGAAAHGGRGRSRPSPRSRGWPARCAASPSSAWAICSSGREVTPCPAARRSG